MESFELVRYEKIGQVGRLEMNRPPHNLLEGSMLKALRSALAHAIEDGCRAILLASARRHFSAGADLAAAYSGDLQKLDFIAFLQELENLPVPTVCAVHGLALGGGFELALGCDLIVAAENAEIGLVETSLGLYPIMGGVSRVAIRAGTARAREMTLLGRRYSAATLQKWGVINHVVPQESLAEAAMSMAQQLAAGPTLAYRAIRQLSNVTASEGVQAADALSRELAAGVWKSGDVKASLDSFRETGAVSVVFNGS